MTAMPFDQEYVPPPSAFRSIEVVVQFKTVVRIGAIETVGGVLF